MHLDHVVGETEKSMSRASRHVSGRARRINLHLSYLRSLIAKCIFYPILVVFFIFCIYYLYLIFHPEITSDKFDLSFVRELAKGKYVVDLALPTLYTTIRCMEVLVGSLILAFVTSAPFLGQRLTWIRPFLRSMFDTARAIPVTLFAPMFIRLYGIDDARLILWPAVIVVAAIWANGIASALEEVDRPRLFYYHSIAQTANKWRVLRELYIPKVIEGIRSDCRVAVTYTVLIVLVLEYVFPQPIAAGLGAYVKKAQDNYEKSLTLAPVFVIVAVAAALLVHVLEATRKRLGGVRR